MPHVDIWRNGSKLVSVTQLTTIIAKPFLDTWKTKLCHCKTHATAKKSPLKPLEKAAVEKFGLGHCGSVYADQVRDDAGDLGTDVHQLVEDWFKGIQLPSTTGEAVQWASLIAQTYQAHNVKPAIILPEANMIDEGSNLAGSPDTIGEWDGRIEILDTKIKNSLDDLTAMQGCGYRYLLRRTKNVDVRFMRAVWCKKALVNKAIETVVYDLDEWMGDWKALVQVWNRLNPKRKVTIHD